jgi:hypothetical protein
MTPCERKSVVPMVFALMRAGAALYIDCHSKA